MKSWQAHADARGVGIANARAPCAIRAGVRRALIAFPAVPAITRWGVADATTMAIAIRGRAGVHVHLAIDPFMWIYARALPIVTTTRCRGT